MNRVARAVVVVTNAHRCCMLKLTGELCWRKIALVRWVVQRTVTVTVTITVTVTDVTVHAVAAYKCNKAYAAINLGVDLLDVS